MNLRAILAENEVVLGISEKEDVIFVVVRSNIDFYYCHRHLYLINDTPMSLLDLSELRDNEATLITLQEKVLWEYGCHQWVSPIQFGNKFLLWPHQLQRKTQRLNDLEEINKSLVRNELMSGTAICSLNQSGKLNHFTYAHLIRVSTDNYWVKFSEMGHTIENPYNHDIFTDEGYTFDYQYEILAYYGFRVWCNEAGIIGAIV